MPLDGRDDLVRLIFVRLKQCQPQIELKLIELILFCPHPLHEEFVTPWGNPPLTWRVCLNVAGRAFLVPQFKFSGFPWDNRGGELRQLTEQLHERAA